MLKKLVVFFSFIFSIHNTLAVLIDDTVGWNITKTGSEIYLNVDFNIINDTCTEFCISTFNYLDYVNDLIKNNKYSPTIQIEKIKGDNINIDKTSLNIDELTNGALCFHLNYEKLQLGISIKIGENSIIIDSDAVNTATYLHFSKNIARSSNGTLYVAYESIDDDWWFGKSDDDGNTWSTQELDAINSLGIGILVDSQDNIISYADRGNDVGFINSTDGGTTWSSIYSIMGAYTRPSCVLDVDDIVHCVAINSSQYPVYFNLTDNESVMNIHFNDLDDSDYCDIETDMNGCVHIVCIGTDTDIYHYWGTCTTGFGDAQRVNIYDSGSHGYWGAPTIAIRGDNIYVAGVYYFDSKVFNSTISTAGSTWTITNVDATTTSFNEIAISEAGHIHILYANKSTFNNYSQLHQANSTDSINYDTLNLIQEHASYPSIADSNYPVFNRLNDTIYYVYTRWDGGIEFDSYTIPIEGEEAPPAATGACNCTFPNDFTIDKTINMSCLCNTTATSWCRNILFTGDESGWWNASATISIKNLSAPPNNTIIWTSSNTYINTS